VKLSCLFFIAALTALGCAPRVMVQQQTSGISTAPTPAVISAPALVNVHEIVSDPDYQTALGRINGSEASDTNARDFQTVAQYQYNHLDLVNAFKNYQLLVSLSGSQQDKSQYMVGQIYYDQKNYLSALAAFQSVMGTYPDSVYSTQSREMTEFVLNHFLGLDDLRSFVTNYSDSPLKCTALFQLGSHEAQAGMQQEAYDHLSRFVLQCPGDASVSAAQTILRSLQVKNTSNKTWRIGVLVPTTGRYKSFGGSVLDGALLAAEEAEQSGATHNMVTVVVRDTGGDSVKAAKVFQDLTADNSLDAIVGPVLPAEFSVVGSLANQQKITMICPSDPHDGLSTLGPYLFSNSMTNEMQGRAMAKYAIMHLGFKQFGVLAPDDSDSNNYGNTLAQSFGDAVKAGGATVASVQTYPSNSTDFREQLVALGGQDPNAVKEGDREGKRRLDDLNYKIGKEIEKILVLSKDITASQPVIDTPTPNPSQTPTPVYGPAIAFVVLPEVVSADKTEPLLSASLGDTVKTALNAQKAYAVRGDDLIKQSFTRLPKGTDFPETQEQWGDLAQDTQASLIITLRVNDDVSKDPVYGSTWLYGLHFEAYQYDVASRHFTKIYQNKVLYNAIKPTMAAQNTDNIQALYLPGHVAVEIPQIASQVHFYGLNPVLLGGHLWENDTVRQEGGKDVEGSYYVTGFYVDSTQGKVKKFADDFLKRFNKRPDLLAAQSYDAMNLMLKATLMSSTRDDIHTNLLAITNYDGVSGVTSFAGHGEADKLVPVMKIQNGQLQQVQ
jgi:ABC-type branched-subunit amino acid transport system substrate-binding protein